MLWLKFFVQVSHMIRILRKKKKLNKQQKKATIIKKN